MGEIEQIVLAKFSQKKHSWVENALGILISLQNEIICPLFHNITRAHRRGMIHFTLSISFNDHF